MVRDLPDQPLIDKHALVGGCVRLPLSIDAERLAAEVDGPAASDVWDIRGGSNAIPSRASIGAAETVFLRGHTPAEGDMPIEDRPPLDELPYIRQLIEREIGTRPQRCLLARLPAGASVIAAHRPGAVFFQDTARARAGRVPRPGLDGMRGSRLSDEARRGMGAQQHHGARASGTRIRGSRGPT